MKVCCFAPIYSYDTKRTMIKDFIELSMIPPDPVKCPFREMRLVIPIRLTTDPWSSDGYMLAGADSDFSAPSTPPDSQSQ